MILQAVNEIMGYAYAHCDERLKVDINLDNLIKEGSKLKRKEFYQAVLFMKCDGYFSDKSNEFSTVSDGSTPSFSVTILPRLIREVEDPSRQHTV